MNLKFQASKNNNQISTNYPNSNKQNKNYVMFGISVIKYWNLFDYWCLIIGISYIICTKIHRNYFKIILNSDYMV
jgi:hypothetical protein